jgi:hypothetical protein
MNHFLTRKTAAEAIAAQLHPNDAERREQAAGNYFCLLYDDLCDFRLVGHDPESFAPITRRGLAGAIALGGSLISMRDLNAWLDLQDLGIQVSNGERTPEILTLPSNEQLLAEKQALKNEDRRRCNVILGEKYGVTPRLIKDRCTEARKSSATPPVSNSAFYPSSTLIRPSSRPSSDVQSQEETTA